MSLAFLLLLLSGDVELNPGPMTAEQASREIQNSLKKHFSDVKQATRNCIRPIADKLYSYNIISEEVKSSPTYDTIANDFQAGMTLKKDLKQLEEYCRLFLDSLSCQGGPTQIVADTLEAEWNTIFTKEASSPLAAGPMSLPAPQPLPAEPPLDRALSIKDLRNVLKLLKKGSFCGKWNDLGLELGLWQPTLNNIEANCSKDVEECLKKCIEKWLTRADGVDDRSVTLTALIDALQEMEQKTTADYIRSNGK